MGYTITIPTYEMKANFSRYVRALQRGDCDIVVIKRYGRSTVALVSLIPKDRPALEPETKADLSMRRRAKWVDTGVPSRRGR